MQDETASGCAADAQMSQPRCPPLVHVQETHLSWNPVHGGGQQWTWALQGGSKQRQDPTHPIRPLASALSNTQMK